MSMRCFAAIELDGAIQKKLGQLQGRFQREYRLRDPEIKWVRPGNIHLTLKFLGEVPDSQITQVCSAVSQAASQAKPFEIEIGDCGCFPPRGAARVMWVGVVAGIEPLAALQQELELSLIDLGFEPESRPFRGHLTLARIKNARVGHLVREVVEGVGPVSLGMQSAAEITVFQSQLARGGPTYIPLHHAPLSL